MKQPLFQDAFEYAKRQVNRVVETYPEDYYPMYTVGGKFGKDLKRWTHWCDGFYPGMMFIFAEHTGEDMWLDRAIRRSLPLEERQFDRSVHDLGFLFFSTYLRWLELGGPAEKIEPVLDQAGKTMAMRFMERGQYLRSFVEPASLFIDIMMNVGTVFRAGTRLKDGHLLSIARRHCDTTRRNLVRGDGSTAHEAIFDLESGECLRQSTHQGYRGDSCWSRGLAWSLYGFTRSFMQSSHAPYLETACCNADFFIEQAGGDRIAPWDFDAPLDGPLARNQVDTSASAIAASGLLDLSAVVPDRYRGAAYRDFALRSLEALCEGYLGSKTEGFEGVLNGGVYHIHKGLGVNEAVLFGDYFFIEALSKALKLSMACPQPKRVSPYPEESLPVWAKTWADGPTEEQL